MIFLLDTDKCSPGHGDLGLNVPWPYKLDTFSELPDSAELFFFRDTCNSGILGTAEQIVNYRARIGIDFTVDIGHSREGDSHRLFSYNCN